MAQPRTSTATSATSASLARQTSRFNLNFWKDSGRGTEGAALAPKREHGCSHLVSFEADYRYHIRAHAAPTRTKSFDKDLGISVQTNLASLRDPDIINRDPRLTFLADGKMDLPAPPACGSSGGYLLPSASRSAPNLLAMSSSSRRKPLRLEPLSQTAPARASACGGSSSTGDGLRDGRESLAPLIHSLACSPERLAKLEVAAALFDDSHTELVNVACNSMAAATEEPHNPNKSHAADTALHELSRHRYFIPERAGGPVARYEQRSKPATKPKPKEAWSLPRSIWAGRTRWCDAADYCDTEEVRGKRMHRHACPCTATHASTAHAPL